MVLLLLVRVRAPAPCTAAAMPDIARRFTIREHAARVHAAVAAHAHATLWRFGGVPGVVDHADVTGTGVSGASR